MKKTISLTISAVFLLAFVLLPGFVSAASSNLSEEEKVIQTVNNYFKSLKEQNSTLYLQSVADNDSASTKSFAANMKEKNLDYSILKTQKINELRYQVDVKKTVNGVEYPVIPYDVVLKDSQWKLDNSSIYVYPKDTVEKMVQKIKEAGYQTDNFYSTFTKNVVSENDQFYIVKRPTSDLGIQGQLTYNFNQNSTDIYANGTFKVFSDPVPNGEDPNKNFVVAELYDEATEDHYLMTTEILNPDVKDSVDFSPQYNYRSVTVYNFNFLTPGKFTVVY